MNPNTKVGIVIVGVLVACLTIATIVLVVQKSSLTKDLGEVQGKLAKLSMDIKPIQHSSFPTVPASKQIDYRLPRTLIPRHYGLYLHPNIESGNFSGEVRILITAIKATNQIKLHSLNLVINNTYLVNVDKRKTFIKKFYFDLVRQFLVINLSRNIAKNTNFTLGITFQGSMTGKLLGLYTSSYLKQDGTRRIITTSHFEPTSARQAFPCFDEPAMKATFEITLVHPLYQNYHALSNMDISLKVQKNNYTEVYFNKTVPMSTYLACFIISDFANQSIKINTKGIGDKFELRIFATPDQINKTNFALTVGKSVMEFYIDYFQNEFSLPKLDMVAIPDFSAGAMENWGVVTCRESLLLYNEFNNSMADKQSIAAIIGHEFAHMWFGNLVTMMWWNDLWLKEGIATYIQDKAVDSVFPEWHMDDQFIVDKLHRIFKLDATLASHPIVQPVHNPSQIAELFDSITYFKGASIIRMLQDLLGAEIFRQAARNYLNAYKYKNAATRDFFTEIEKMNLDFKVTTFLRTWTEQMGLPVVDVTEISATKLKLKQKRFFSNPDNYKSKYALSPFNYTWSIPITFKTNALEGVQRDWILYNQNEITITLPSGVEWVKFNYNQVGYYLVNYPDSMWKNLALRLSANPHTFSIGDRVSLLHDAFFLAESTQLSYDVALDMTKYLEKETDYVPWKMAAEKLTSLNRKLFYTETFPDYNNYARKLISPIYKSVTWNIKDDHLKSHLRSTVLYAACFLKLSDCLSEATKQFKQWLEKPSVHLHPGFRDVVYYFGMLNSGDDEVWEKMWKLFLAEKDSSEKNKLMAGLAGVQQPWLLKRFVDLAWDEGNVRSQDYFDCMEIIAYNPIGEPIVWDYVRNNWDKFIERFGLNEHKLGYLIASITSHFSTRIKLEEMKIFFSMYLKEESSKTARVQAIETVKNNIAWLENNRISIENWLKRQKVN